MQSNDLPVEDDHEITVLVDLAGGIVTDVLHSEVDGNAQQRLLIILGRDVSEQRKVLCETAGLAVWRVRRTDQPPVATE